MLPFGTRSERNKMPKYFMRGTKHESFERMMMSPSRKVEEQNENSREETNTDERSSKKDDLPSGSK